MPQLRWFSLILWCCVISSGMAQEPQANTDKALVHHTVFAEGKDGYAKVRIPAIVATQRGKLLAFAEGRTGGDTGPIDVVLKTSTDNGKTWSDLKVLWDDGDNTCGNPCPVVDQSTGTIWLLLTWNKGTDSEGEIMAGKSEDVRHVYVMSSKDDGETWSSPKRISETTRRDYWRWYATGPGNGIQLSRGKYAGRLLIPCNHSDHSDPKEHPYRSHVIYSDDHGDTWKLGGVHEARTNESAVVELSDGRVLQQMRSYHDKGVRAMAISDDGGDSWGKVFLDSTLNTPVCQANILRYSWPETKDSRDANLIFFSSPRGKDRKAMTVWSSRDDGRSWEIHKHVFPGGSAYSNLVVMPNGELGLLYEKDNYKTISFVSWLVR
jgi:sialidase-1